MLAINNAIISHGVRIRPAAARAPVLGFNGLWENETDYGDGAGPGAGALHAAPAFIDPENGDFHL